jgi:putative peptide zinc metalloprotease protein
MSARRIGAKLRADLQVSHQRRAGVDRAVIKDPHTLRFFELAWDDYQFALRIEAAATAREIAERWQRLLPELCAGRDGPELERRAERLCAAMHRLGLAEHTGAALRTEPVILSWNAWALRWVRRISAPMFVRARLFDPDEWLGELVQRWRPLFSTPALALAAVFVFVSLLAALGYLDEMQFHPEWFRAWPHLLALYLGILVLKVIHESGHALVCKALGGSVHEVGAQLLAFHPTFFVDVSDTWMWPDRRRRIAVAAAGFGAEMIAAAALFWLWRLLSPGFARDLCLNLMFIASVSAVLFNANPLMRYDGYHMLADFLREPLLRQKSFATLSQTVRRWVFGRHLVPAVAEKRQWIFGLYGLLSTAYLVWIVFAIGGFLRRLLAPFGLEAVGQVLLAAWLVSMLLPLVRFLGGLVRDTARVAPEHRGRPIVVGASLAALVVVVMFVPLPVRVERECVIEVSAAGVLRAAQPGWIAELHVREGDRVRKGQPLARLQNRDLTLARTKAEIDVGLAKVEMMSAVGENRAERVQQGVRRFNEASATAAQAAHRCDELELLSPCDGVVLTHYLERKLGQMVRPGDEVVAIGEDARRECLLPLTEKEARRIQKGAPVAFLAKAFSAEKFSGKISSAPLRIKGDDLPRALTALAGGDITVDPSGKVFSSEVTHVSRFRLDPADPRLCPGLTGRARLDCGRLPVGQWLLEKALDAIHLDHRI